MFMILRTVSFEIKKELKQNILDVPMNIHCFIEKDQFTNTDVDI